ncbi:MAG TPA: hypothetical protein VFQ45_10685 [Longimicrobium sp.]|nr:hypothetical protein [Longimicrobium sp.]
MRTTLRTSLLSIATVVLLSACSGGGELDTLARGIERDLKVPTAIIEASHTSLEVIVYNHPLAGGTDAQREAAARQTAEYVRDHYADYGLLAQVVVELKAKGGGAMSYATRTQVYTFSRRELGRPRTSAA